MVQVVLVQRRDHEVELVAWVRKLEYGLEPEENPAEVRIDPDGLQFVVRVTEDPTVMHTQEDIAQDL